MADFPWSRRARDHLCDQFEKEWISDQQFRIESFLEQQPEKFGNETIDELLIVEIELRHSHGQTPVRSEYRKRFPTRLQAIDIGFERVQEFDQTKIVTSTENGSGNASIGTTNVATIPETVGEFRIVRRLGVGAFGAVYKATSTDSGKSYALKFPTRRTVLSTEELLQIKNEAEAAKHLDHPAIVKSFGLRNAAGFLFAVQQLVDGCTLDQVQLSEPNQIVGIIARVAEGLGHAHQRKLIHRDLKPSNIMIDRGGQPLIVDFGLAVHESAQRRLKGQRCGTPPYMSPEQVLGLTHQLDGRSDIWSLGVVLYELLANRRPFDGSSHDEIFEEIKSRNEKPLCMVRPDLDHELQRICLKCLAKPIPDRYNSANELADDLNNWLRFEDEWRSKTHVPLITRGLRSYGPQDAEAYVRLVPGQSDRFGIPVNIQFWKQKLESTPSSQSFAIGTILGPCGCGKSSFVKAGLLPQLDPNIINSIYVEATTSNTEERISKSLQLAIPGIPDGLSLAHIVDGVKNSVWSNEGKWLIVIDQFEQWLAANPKNNSSELVQALRHCDGKNLFCILSTRDEFWLESSRLFNTLGVGWSEESNVQRFDLLDEPHAQNVLYQIGRSFKRFPIDKTQMMPAQVGFVQHVVSELAESGFVICVHLVLFAEMFQKRDWTVDELGEVGGISGIGETYLEEVFGENSTDPLARRFGDEAVAILELLLPTPGVSHRTQICHANDLKKSVPKLSQDEFENLIDWLAKRLRLITQTGTVYKDSDNDESGTTEIRPPEEYRHYQLTHDYLVPSIRNWTKVNQNKTPKGRFNAIYSGLAQGWRSSQDNRFLPTFVEFLTSIRYLDRRSLAGAERDLYLHSLKHYLARTSVVLLVFAFVVFGSYGVFNRWQNFSADQIASRFIQGPPETVSDNAKTMSLDKNSSLRALRKLKLEEKDEQNRVRINIGLALLGQNDAILVHELIGAISKENDLESQNILTAIDRFENSDTLLLKAFQRNSEVESKIRIAISFCILGHTDRLQELVEPFIKAQPDLETDFYTLFIQTMPKWTGEYSQFFDALDRTQDERYQALACQCIGKLLNANTIQGLSPEAIDRLQQIFEDNSSNAASAAAEWVLRIIGESPSHLESDPQGQYHINSLNLKLVKIPSGSTVVNLNRAGTRIQKQIEFEQPFYMSDREISVHEYLEFLNDENSAAAETYRSFEATDKQSHPAQNISMNDAVRFCNWLSKREGRMPYYHFADDPNRDEKVPLSQIANSAPDSNGYRLPTYAEWHHSLGLTHADVHYFGSEQMNSFLTDYAWIESNSQSTSHPTKLKIPNRHGLFDMYGNVQEYCTEFPFYEELSPSDTQSFTTAKGGGFASLPLSTLPTSFAPVPPGTPVAATGFRVVLDSQDLNSTPKQTGPKSP